jgi:uncharacterized protein
MLFRLIYYAIVAYIVYIVIRFFQNLGRSLRPSAPSSAQPRLSGQMVKDEACGTYISKDEALREVIDGEERFFCSKECRKKFLAERKAAR